MNRIHPSLAFALVIGCAQEPSPPPAAPAAPAATPAPEVTAVAEAVAPTPAEPTPSGEAASPMAEAHDHGAAGHDHAHHEGRKEIDPRGKRERDADAAQGEGKGGESEAMPPKLAGMQGLLNSKEKSDSIGKGSLDKSGGDEGLRWFADHDDALVVRARALELIGLYPTSENEGYLTRIVLDQGANAKVRAGAIEGLGKMGLSTRGKSRAAVVRALSDSNPSVGVAAVRALKGVPEAKDELTKLSQNKDAAEPVRNAALAAIK